MAIRAAGDRTEVEARDSVRRQARGPLIDAMSCEVEECGRLVYRLSSQRQMDVSLNNVGTSAK